MCLHRMCVARQNTIEPIMISDAFRVANCPVLAGTSRILGLIYVSRTQWWE